MATSPVPTAAASNGATQERPTQGSRRRLRKPTARVLHGDAFALALRLPKASVDAIVTSPPYWGQRTYDIDHDGGLLRAWEGEGHRREEVPPWRWYSEHGGALGQEPLPEWYVAHLVDFFDQVRPALRPSASVWVNLGDTYFARWASIRDKGRQGLGDNPRTRRRTPMGGFRQEKQLLLLPARFAIAMQDRRWILRNDLIWFKPNVPPRPERDRLRLSHEHFFHFALRPTQGRAKYHYDLAAVEPKAYDVVTCNVAPGENGHSATFPTALIEPRIRSSCPAGGTLLDPFCGSGRALTVACSSGRNALGFDANSDFVSAVQATLAKRGWAALA